MPSFWSEKELPEFDINRQQEHICGIGVVAMDRHWGVRGKKMGMDFKMANLKFLNAQSLLQKSVKLPTVPMLQKHVFFSNEQGKLGWFQY